MSEEQSKSLADRLIEADNAEAVESSTDQAGAIDPAFESMLEDERRFEKRVRRLALLSWAATFACMILVVGSVHIIRYSGSSDTMVDLARSVLMMFGFTGIISLLAAILTSLVWLFRSRTPTLRAIERRLGALEKLLMQQK